MSLFEKGSLSVGRYFNIPVKLHWTFGYIAFYIIYVGVKDNLGFHGAIWFGLFILSLFLCVVLHEYGHALMARRFGIQTVDITLTPLGGIARLPKLPDKPVQELLVALAGPAVNVVIAFLIYLYIRYFTSLDPIGQLASIYNFAGNLDKFLLALMWVNVTLLFFNLLPVFPMDGGRVLRSLIALKWSKYTATLIAARLGQVFSVGFLGLGIYSGDFILALIGIFIFQGAWMELQHTRLETKLKSNSILPHLIDRFEILEADESLERVREMAIFYNQPYFPVSLHNRLIGCIEREQLFSGSAIGLVIGNLALKPIATMSANENFYAVYNTFANGKVEVIVFENNGQFVGLIDKHSFFSLLVKNQIIKRA